MGEKAVTDEARKRAERLLREISVSGPFAFVRAHAGKQSGEDISSMLGYLFERLEDTEEIRRRCREES